MPIQLLDAYTAAQIAAGEVVERPASIVKELLENAVDASATEIRVELRGGGKHEIRIIDNGSGIPADEVELAFQRHATSKLRTADDLYTIHTLGFRGEALPAIATVAHVTCITRAANADIGVELRLAGGEIQSRAPHGGPPGTTFIVRNLFFNAPVRLKFLKSDAAEAAKVAEIVTGYALAYPEIRWSLVSDGAVQLQTPGFGKLLDALIAVFQLDIARDMIPVDEAAGTGEMHTRIHGYISRPTISKGTRAGIHLFVNRRAIKATPGVHAELRNAYHILLLKDRHPFAVLNIDIDPGAVDVNVHPAKTEVKFRFEGEILALLGRVLRQALAEHAAVPAFPPDRSGRDPTLHRDERAEQAPRSVPPPTIHATDPVAARSAEETAAAPVDRRATPAAPGDDRAAEVPATASASRGPAPTVEARRSLPDPAAQGKIPRPPTGHRDARTAGPPVAPSTRRPRVSPAHLDRIQEAPGAAADRPPRLPSLQVIGQSQHRYILADGPDGLYVVDQHAAHERVIYERLLQLEREAPLPQQHMLPTCVPVAPALARLLLGHREALARWGFTVEAGETDGDLIVRAVPAGLPEGEVGPALRELGEQLQQAGGSNPQQRREQAITTIACHSAVRAGQVQSRDEMADLLRQLERCAEPRACAHGHPTLQVITEARLDQLFGRNG